eukprot:178095-Amphidinium_carterae.1
MNPWTAHVHMAAAVARIHGQCRCKLPKEGPIKQPYYCMCGQSVRCREGVARASLPDQSSCVSAESISSTNTSIEACANAKRSEMDFHVKRTGLTVTFVASG